MGHTGKASSSFIIRIWWESNEEANKTFWRGRAEHIQSGEVFYFETPEDLIRFMMQCLKEVPAQSRVEGKGSASGRE